MYFAISTFVFFFQIKYYGLENSLLDFVISYYKTKSH